MNEIYEGITGEYKDDIKRVLKEVRKKSVKRFKKDETLAYESATDDAISAITIGLGALAHVSKFADIEMGLAASRKLLLRIATVAAEAVLAIDVESLDADACDCAIDCG